MTTTYENKCEIKKQEQDQEQDQEQEQEQEQEQDQDQDQEQEQEQDQEEINASFQRLLELDELEEEVLDINCCIVCKTLMVKWMNFCSAVCENKFTSQYEIHMKTPV
jgi:hypothetical protein